MLTTRQEIGKESVISKSVLNLSLTPKAATDPGPWGGSGETGFQLTLTPVQRGGQSCGAPHGPTLHRLAILTYEGTSRPVARPLLAD